MPRRSKFAKPQVTNAKFGALDQSGHSQLSNADNYRIGVKAAHYELHGMIECYGVEFIRALMADICSGNFTRQDLSNNSARWLAYHAMNPSTSYSQYKRSLETIDSIMELASV